MKKFKAPSLEAAYELATKAFNCSITELRIDIIVQPKKGFLGFFKQDAVIHCELKKEDNLQNKQKIRKKGYKNQESVDTTSLKKEQLKYDVISNDKMNSADNKEVGQSIFDSFYDKQEHQDQSISKIVVKKDNDAILKEIKSGIDDLFCDACFNLDEVNVEFYDDQTVYIQFSGKDSALLIGKEGYRYKALSYILFNWINESYNLMVRLEVAQFLKNQEESINRYLEPVIEQIHAKGSYKTKSFDGILIYIVLKRLRETFPEKYVAVKHNQKGSKYIIVNDYRHNK